MGILADAGRNYRELECVAAASVSDGRRNIERKRRLTDVALLWVCCDGSWALASTGGGMRRRGRLWRWGGVFGMALLCLYITFDILDLDGSRPPCPGAATLAETASDDADRLLRASVLPQPVPLHANTLPACELRLRPAVTRCFRRTDRMPPPRYLAHRTASVTDASADPA
jgi:hypothetical protein